MTPETPVADIFVALKATLKRKQTVKPKLVEVFVPTDKLTIARFGKRAIRLEA